MSATKPQAALPKELLRDSWPDLAARLELRPFGSVSRAATRAHEGRRFRPVELRRVFAGRLQAIDTEEVLYGHPKNPKRCGLLRGPMAKVERGETV